MFEYREAGFYDRITKFASDWHATSINLINSAYILRDIAEKNSRDETYSAEDLKKSLNNYNRARYMAKRANNIDLNISTIVKSASSLSQIDVADAFVQLYSDLNSIYLDAIMDYNLIEDSNLKLEYEGNIKVIRDFITMINKLDVYGR